MATEPKQMRPIWHFVGLILLVIGGLVIISGIFNAISPPEELTILQEIHPDLWWGGLMVLVGLFFLWTNKNKTR